LFIKIQKIIKEKNPGARLRKSTHQRSVALEAELEVFVEGRKHAIAGGAELRPHGTL